MTENTQRREALLSSVRTLTHRPSVAFLQPSFPLRPITPWASQLADWGGLRPCLTDKAVGWETLLEVDPEIIVFSVEGGTLAEAGEALATWARQPAVQSLQAFRAKRLYAFKGTAGLFYPAPTIVAAAEALYELAHTPTYRHNRHLGQLWAPLL
jgi:ABC-type Fe3+-hydroxamate transport system substrate-binding protein